MPRKAPTPCRHAGCAALVDKPGFCDAHQRESSGWQRDEHRGSRHERGYGSYWTRLRTRILTRDCGLCQPCLREQRVTKGDAVDHIVSRAEGGSDDENNLQAICKPCHAAKTALESARARARKASPGG
ncbi:HNH endonuclease [Caballeronia sp. dw_276]|uniref:HNH endonuclease n=1 Tax=Caballeronia sp. dw_276 TaxID=2719795 RepID=UPI001BD4D955|nr:HNH endonuclease [Caballeronia sp. dw_276]